MGLLDFLKADDPAVAQGLLQAGLSLLGSKGNFGNALGQAGLQGMQGASQFRQQQFQRQLQQSQLEDMKRKRMMEGRQDTLDALPGRYIVPPSQPGMDATGGLETALEAPQNQASPMGRMDLGGLAQAFMRTPGGLQQGLGLQQSMQKDDTPIKASPGDMFFNRSGKQLFAAPPAPEKPEKMPSAVQEYQFAVGQGYKGSFEQWDTTRKRAGASSVSVNMGQKGYENESKLRNDFKSEPIYKDYQDMATAHKQIKSGIAQGTPIGDVATATKIMKLLDPGSVVRESELAIAMSAAGRMDRLQNFVNLQLKGQKLTPTQRQEFGALADELMAATGQAYNKKRAEYEAMGKRYDLDPTVLGGQYAPQQAAGVPPMSAIDAELARRKGR